MALERPADFKFSWQQALPLESDLPMTVVSTLWALSFFGDADGTNVRPAQATVAALVRKSTRQVRDDLKAAEGAGWIRHVGWHSWSGSKRTKEYELVLPDGVRIDDGLFEGIDDSGSVRKPGLPKQAEVGSEVDGAGFGSGGGSVRKSGAFGSEAWASDNQSLHQPSLDQPALNQSTTDDREPDAWDRAAAGVSATEGSSVWVGGVEIAEFTPLSPEEVAVAVHGDDPSAEGRSPELTPRPSSTGFAEATAGREQSQCGNSVDAPPTLVADPTLSPSPDREDTDGQGRRRLARLDSDEPSIGRRSALARSQEVSTSEGDQWFDEGRGLYLDGAGNVDPGQFRRRR
ncbi:hypothetical protein [Jiangella mangrovi]|uniref:Helix-turn-helix domain-containing protein n=1 Tax=Jiangella mangrovi TaxID=1524084 RepID=A0A7W9GXW1_9ACTN|nr:hypothetical protein [Jiangella mangrovi]MBB5791784.1 hypothetical protein [Jiangella mangrovi]